MSKRVGRHPGKKRNIKHKELKDHRKTSCQEKEHKTQREGQRIIEVSARFLKAAEVLERLLRAGLSELDWVFAV